MDKRAIFEAWAPQGGPWTPWAKAVLFAHVEGVAPQPVAPPAWLRRELLVEGAATYREGAPPTTAIVVDLPGADGVAAGLALAEFGFRPVPLYNSLPGLYPVVPVYDVIGALVGGAARLAERPPPSWAPPAFLVDARRANIGAPDALYDNRAMVFSTDFPSAETLRGAGIASVVLIRASSRRPASDLAAALMPWQTAGLSVRLVAAAAPAAVPVRLGRGPLAWVGDMFRRLELSGDPIRGFGGPRAASG